MDVIVVGDGPGGLSAALFLARAGVSVEVIGQDATAMHWAMLNNYLGLPPETGSAFQTRARAQVTGAGGSLRSAEVVALRGREGAFEVELAGGEVLGCGTLVLSEGKSPKLARSLGCAEGEVGVTVDAQGLTSVPGVYAVGRMVRPTRSQAIISAGDGAAAALDILARRGGRDVQDWDSPPKS